MSGDRSIGLTSVANVIVSDDKSRMKRLFRMIFVVQVMVCASVHAMTVEQYQANGVPVTVVRVNLAQDDVRLFWANDQGGLYRRFERVADHVAQQGKTLSFAMNAGMYHANRAPVGAYVAEGVTRFPLNVSGGVGNFFLAPNGVFAIDRRGQAVIQATAQFAPSMPPHTAWRWVTQSGPMLVHGGQLHPAFRADSVSKTVRNGVGRIDAQHVVFAISEQPINFYDFAQLFKDQLHCADALYFDGSISAMYLHGSKRLPQREDAGVMVGVVEPRPARPQPARYPTRLAP